MFMYAFVCVCVCAHCPLKKNNHLSVGNDHHTHTRAHTHTTSTCWHMHILLYLPVSIIQQDSSMYNLHSDIIWVILEVAQGPPACMFELLVRNGTRWEGGLHRVRAQPSPIMIYIIIIGACMSLGVIAQTVLPFLWGVHTCMLTLRCCMSTFFSLVLAPTIQHMLLIVLWITPGVTKDLLKYRQKMLRNSTEDMSITAVAAGVLSAHAGTANATP